MAILSKKVYLGGYIWNGASQKWRRPLGDNLFRAGFFVFDPVIEQKGMNLTAKELVVRDLDMIKRADIIVFNLGAKLGFSWGCPMEMFYAWSLGRPVILIGDEAELLKHPWIKTISTAVVPYYEELPDYLLNVWGC